MLWKSQQLNLFLIKGKSLDLFFCMYGGKEQWEMSSNLKDTLSGSCIKVKAKEVNLILSNITRSKFCLFLAFWSKFNNVTHAIVLILSNPPGLLAWAIRAWGTCSLSITFSKHSHSVQSSSTHSCSFPPVYLKKYKLSVWVFSTLQFIHRWANNSASHNCSVQTEWTTGEKKIIDNA